MNARDYKLLRPGCHYHIYNRGNNKESIFLDTGDFLVFLQRLKLVLNLIQDQKARIRSLPKEAFTVICYCLMPNHFHFLIRQNTDIGLDRLLSRICTSYSKYFNLKYGRVGHVFQDTFKAKLIASDEYLKYLSAYIHNNPPQPERYDFSSFKDYLGARNGTICDKSFLLSQFQNDPGAYGKFVFAFSERDRKMIASMLFED